MGVHLTQTMTCTPPGTLGTYNCWAHWKLHSAAVMHLPLAACSALSAKPLHAARGSRRLRAFLTSMLPSPDFEQEHRLQPRRCCSALT